MKTEDGAEEMPEGGSGEKSDPRDSEEASPSIHIQVMEMPKVRPISKAVGLRRFKPRDLEEVMELDREVFGGYDPMIFTTFYEYYPATTLVAEDDGRVVGFILGFKHTPTEGRVFWVAVRPGYQGQGIGRRLLTTVIKLFRLIGAVSATLEVRASNFQAQGLYTSLGFQMTGVSPGYYSDGETAIIMKKRI
jgi:ribosomal-protein-alanine N-acetyltransferase